MGKKQNFPNFTGNGEAIAVDWSAERVADCGMIVPPLVGIRASAGGFHFGISLAPAEAERFAAAVLEAAQRAPAAPMTDDRVAVLA